jgi:hypothetical protein
LAWPLVERDAATRQAIGQIREIKARKS